MTFVSLSYLLSLDYYWLCSGCCRFRVRRGVYRLGPFWWSSPDMTRHTLRTHYEIRLFRAGRRTIGTLVTSIVITSVKTQRPKRYANRGSVMSRQHAMTRNLRSGVTGSLAKYQTPTMHFLPPLFLVKKVERKHHNENRTRK